MKNANDTFVRAHQIFVLDAYLTTPLDCTMRTPITKAFIEDALKPLRLKALGPMQIYASVDERAPGWSFIQPITRSQISAHYFEKPSNGPYIRMDVYSCDSINWRELLTVCHRHFSLTQWRGTFVERVIDVDDERAVFDLAGIGNSTTIENRLDTAAMGVSSNKLAVV